MALSVFAVCACAFAADKIRISCIGDSITFGHGIKDVSQKYPQQLGTILGDKYDVRNFGVSGTTALTKGDYPYIKTAQYKSALALKPNIVIIKLGTNDTKPQNWKYCDQYEKNINAIIDAFNALDSKPKIYLCYPCPLFILNSSSISNDRIFNGVIPIIRKIAKDRNLDVIDMFSPFVYKPECFPDRLHPNGAGAKIMAETAAKKILADFEPKK